jgi:hypothetical protein
LKEGELGDGGSEQKKQSISAVIIYPTMLCVPIFPVFGYQQNFWLSDV